MKRLLHYILFLLLATTITQAAYAQGPMGRDFGFGIVLGEPLGGTVKIWTANDQAFTGSIGASYFGSPRIGADYIWHFDAFRSGVVKMYAGPGLAIGIGQGVYYWYYGRRGKYGEVFYYREPGTTGIAARVMIGLNIIPRRTPMEIFFEAGPLIGISPAFGAAFDLALGIRFYP